MNCKNKRLSYGRSMIEIIGVIGVSVLILSMAVVGYNALVEMNKADTLREDVLRVQKFADVQRVSDKAVAYEGTDAEVQALIILGAFKAEHTPFGGKYYLETRDVNKTSATIRDDKYVLWIKGLSDETCQKIVLLDWNDLEGIAGICEAGGEGGWQYRFGDDLRIDISQAEAQCKMKGYSSCSQMSILCYNNRYSEACDYLKDNPEMCRGSFCQHMCGIAGLDWACDELEDKYLVGEEKYGLAASCVQSRDENSMACQKVKEDSSLIDSYYARMLCSKLDTDWACDSFLATNNAGNISRACYESSEDSLSCQYLKENPNLIGGDFIGLLCTPAKSYDWVCDVLKAEIAAGKPDTSAVTTACVRGNTEFCDAISADIDTYADAASYWTQGKICALAGKIDGACDNLLDRFESNPASAGNALQVACNYTGNESSAPCQALANSDLSITNESGYALCSSKRYAWACQKICGKDVCD